MTCNKCGFVNDDSNQFCYNCGDVLEANSSAADPGYQSSAAADAGANGYTAPASNPEGYTPPQSAGQNYAAPDANAQTYGNFQQAYPGYTDNAAYTPYPPVMSVPQDEHVSVGQWVGISLIPLIPCVGAIVYIIMMFVWAFGDTPKKSLKNYARASLIVMGITIVLAILIFVFFAIIGYNLSEIVEDSYNYSYNY